MDFNSTFQTWMNVLTRPGEDTFREELHKPQVSMGTAIIWIVIAAVILAVFTAIGAVISGLIGGGASLTQMMLENADLPPEVAAQLATSTAGSTAGSVVGAFIGGLILAPIGFIIGALIYFGVAKLFSGTGNFEQHTYMLATFTAPLMIVNGVIGVIPILGGCISFFVWIYQVVLTYFAMKVTHNLSSGQAIMVALVPVIIGLVCAACAFFAAFSLIFGAAAAGS